MSFSVWLSPSLFGQENHGDVFLSSVIYTGGLYLWFDYLALLYFAILISSGKFYTHKKTKNDPGVHGGQ